MLMGAERNKPKYKDDNVRNKLSCYCIVADEEG